MFERFQNMAASGNYDEFTFYNLPTETATGGVL